MKTEMLTLLLATLGLPAASHGQESKSTESKAPAQQAAPGQAERHRGEEFFILSSELKLLTFRPEHASTKDLLRVIDGLFEDQLTVLEREGGKPRPVRRFQLFGNAILIRDTSAGAKPLLETLEQLDLEARSVPAADESLVTYRPRFKSAQHLFEAVLPLTRQSAENAPIDLTITTGGLLVLRDRKETAGRVLGFLKEIDRPDPQLMLICQLIQGCSAEDSGGGKVAPEIENELKKMLPIPAFSTLATGVIRCSSYSQQPLTLVLCYPGGSCEISMQPEAFDAQTGLLTVGSCKFEVRGLTVPGPQAGVSSQSFNSVFTRLSMTAGRYTVLGAVGADPYFMVVKVSVVE